MATREELELELASILEDCHITFVSKYADEIDGLLGLSREEIDAITPGTTDLETYDKLIAVVKDASKKNVSQAELKDRIEFLGGVAVEIAKKAGSLAKLFL